MDSPKPVDSCHEFFPRRPLSYLPYAGKFLPVLLFFSLPFEEVVSWTTDTKWGSKMTFTVDLSVLLPYLLPQFHLLPFVMSSYTTPLHSGKNLFVCVVVIVFF